MRSFVLALERLTSGVGYLAAVIVLPLALATAYDVFARYVLLDPTIWAFELGYSLMGAHFLLGSAITLKLQGHIRIDLFYARMSRRTQAAIDLVLYVVLYLPFLLLLSHSLYSYALASIASGERTGQSAWNPPIWPLRIAISTGIALLAVQVLAEILKCVATLRGRPIDDRAEA